MRVLNKAEYELLETLVRSDKMHTALFCSAALKKYYDNVIETNQYIYAEGNIPIALVSHMDTVFEREANYKNRELFYDRAKNVMWCPRGAGFDDKAGIFAILTILKDGFRPHVIFTMDEEIGGLGASALADTYKFHPFNDLKYIIQLDRRNTNDCVFYDCDNEEFIDYVEKFGFSEAYGSFSDISELCPSWMVAGVNLSIGYDNEHTISEYLNVTALFATIKKVKNMLSETEIPFFEYVPSYFGYGRYFGGHGHSGYPYDDYYDYYGYNDFHGKSRFHEKTKREEEKTHYFCTFCGQEFEAEEVLPVQLIDGTEGYVCPDCMEEHVNWCDMCGEGFEKDPEFPEKNFCPECYKELMDGYYY